MRTSSGAKRLDYAAARNCFMLNQLATPGLGSLMAGRIFQGIGQIVVAVMGFALVAMWFVQTMIQTYNQFTNDAPAKSYGWLGGAGAVVFAIAWLWSLATSVSLLRQAKRESQADPSNVPPRITNPPSKM